MQTNNLMSNIMISGTQGVTPEVGMGATLCHYTDRHAATIVNIWDVRGTMYMTVQRDHAKRIDNYGMSDMQEYEYSRDTDGSIYHYRFRNGKWEGARMNSETGRWNKSENPGLVIGSRREYYDFSF